jgi:hypothetical protein
VQHTTITRVKTRLRLKLYISKLPRRIKQVVIHRGTASPLTAEPPSSADASLFCLATKSATPTLDGRLHDRGIAEIVKPEYWSKTERKAGAVLRAEISGISTVPTQAAMVVKTGVMLAKTTSAPKLLGNNPTNIDIENRDRGV